MLLPVGISFFTFHTLSYTIDVYRGTMAPTSQLLDFAIFVAFFPLLVAGPIIRAAQFLPQLARDPEWSDERASVGLYLILKGLVKKALVADVIGAALVDGVFAAPGASHGWPVLLAIYGYAFQIYGDFAGYSDIALGSAKLLGLELPVNFRRPYRATNLRDFWQRWHISLSTWLRDYLYIPLGGSRRSPLRTQLNLFLTMLLGGLWHGANWTFVAWGALHGGALCVTRAVQKRSATLGKPKRPDPWWSLWGKRLLTAHLVCLGWVLFRATTFHDAWTVLGAIPTPGASLIAYLTGSRERLFAGAMLLCALLANLLPDSWALALQQHYAQASPRLQALVVATILVTVSAFAQAGAPFIYFQF